MWILRTHAHGCTPSHETPPTRVPRSLFLAVMFDEFINAKADDKALEEALRRAGAPGAKAQPQTPSPEERQAVLTSAAQERLRLMPAGALASDDAEGDRAGGSSAGAISARTDYSSLTSPRSDYTGATSFTSAPGGERVRRNSQEEPPAPATALGRLVTSDSFSHMATFLVLTNMALMCMPYHGMSDGYASKIERVSTTISLIFMLEMFLKLLGLGCIGYWSDKWNMLDGTIVSLSIFEMIMTALASGTGIKLSFLRMLRLLRVLRVLRLMRSWHGLYRVISSFIKAMPQLFNMFVCPPAPLHLDDIR